MFPLSSSPQFQGMAHIIRPKADLGYHIGVETGRLKANTPTKVWTQEFPFDARKDEAILLSGKDLEKAGNTDQWTFQDALYYAGQIVRPNVALETTTTPSTGGLREESCTTTNGRAVFYRYQA